MFDTSRFLPLLTDLPDAGRFWIAYSGGLDSHVLLHALANAPQKLPLAAIHINHGWSPRASAWAAHCMEICNVLGIDCKVIKINMQPQAGQSLEAAARAARYQAFATLMAPKDCLLTAHQQNDQAETLLLQLFRGAGVKGLAAMPELTFFAEGYHLRPLLHFSRAELLAYAQRHRLVWIEDESNLNLRFDRNFIRHQLMPVIQQRWPAAVSTLARTANHCAEAAELLTGIAAEDLKNLTGSQAGTLSISQLLLLNTAQRHNVIRYWLRQRNFPVPSEVQLAHIERDILLSRADAYPKINWDKVEIRRHQNDLYVLPIDKEQALPQNAIWDFSQPLKIPDVGTLIANLVLDTGICQSAIPDGKVIIRFRQGGERFHPVGRQGSHPLKKLFQEWRIPPWQRDRIPLLFHGEKLIAVVGYSVDAQVAAQAGETGWDIVLEYGGRLGRID